MKKLVSIILLVGVLGVAVAMPVAAKNEKVPVCHVDEEGNVKLISVSTNVEDAHKRHGDPVIGVDVDENCQDTLDPILVVPKTGQTTCYAAAGAVIACVGTGQDGEYQTGILPALAPTSGTTGAYNTPVWTGVRFTDNGDGTVTDNLTGLIWLRNANCFGGKPWATALSDANNLAHGDCNLSDGSSAGQWRLPNVNELHSLIDLTQSNPALPANHPFTGVQLAPYPTSTTFSGYPTDVWVVGLHTGYVARYPKHKPAWGVWPVRGGQ